MFLNGFSSEIRDGKMAEAFQRKVAHVHILVCEEPT